MIEIYDNLAPKKGQHIDARLQTVANIAALPDPTVASNFIYEGAIAYVAGTVNSFFKCVLVSSVKTWVLFNDSELVIGTINITPSTTSLDLSIVSPDISECYAVLVNVIGGTSATIQSIQNMPGSDKLITFFTIPGQNITFRHFDYDVATTDQVVLENGFDMTITGRVIGNESLTLKQHGVALCQWDATQFMKSTEWLQNLLNQTVIDNLTSTEVGEPLSANQGRILKELIDDKQDALTFGDFLGLSGNQLNVLPPNIVLTEGGAIPLLVDRQTFLTNTAFNDDSYNFVNFNETILYVLNIGQDSSVLSNWKLLVGESTATGGTGSSIDHTSLTSGDGSPGTIDTYTLWADVAETVPVGTFDVYQGADSVNVANSDLFRASQLNNLTISWLGPNTLIENIPLQLVNDYDSGNYDDGGVWNTSGWTCPAVDDGKDMAFFLSIEGVYHHLENFAFPEVLVLSISLTGTGQPTSSAGLFDSQTATVTIGVDYAFSANLTIPAFTVSTGDSVSATLQVQRSNGSNTNLTNSIEITSATIYNTI